MSLPTHGVHTSATEVTHVSPFGIWLLASSGKELFLSYENFPWFKDQIVKAIYNVEEPTPSHFYWPDLDVDLTEAMIEKPAAYPLVSRK